MADLWTSSDAISDEDAQLIIDRETGTGVADEDLGEEEEIAEPFDPAALLSGQ